MAFSFHHKDRSNLKWHLDCCELYNEGLLSLATAASERLLLRSFLFFLFTFMTAVEIHQVTKTFGDHVAVDELSLRVPAGTVYGFIGPNGSGKTTTLRMIMRILHPDCGEIRVLGETALAAANDRVGYLPEERGLYKQMKVRAVLRFYAELNGLRDSKTAIESWLERMGLADRPDKKVEALPKVMSPTLQLLQQ